MDYRDFNFNPMGMQFTTQHRETSKPVEDASYRIVPYTEDELVQMYSKYVTAKDVNDGR